MWGATVEEENSLQGVEPVEWIGKPSIMAWVVKDRKWKKAGFVFLNAALRASNGCSCRRQDPSLSIFTTDISVARGATVEFKINSGSPYTLDIYRLGWYGGLGVSRGWEGVFLLSTI